MKILIAGSLDSFSAETGYARLFRERGCDVLVWDNKSPMLLFGNRSWWALNRAEKAAYDALASARLYKACCQFKPDVLFMPKAENIHSFAVRRVIRETRTRLVVWYPDNPFKADQTSMNILRDFRRCDIFYIWGKFLVDPLRSAGCRRVEYLPFAYDPVVHPAESVVAEADREHYASDICFIGTWDEERQAAIEPLSEFNLAVWGPFWRENVPKESPLAPCIRQSGGLFGEDMVKAFKSAKVVFNHLREHNGSAHNVRTMEVAGIGGGPMLVRRTVEQSRELFCEDKHLACFEGAKEMQEKARYLLQNPAVCKSMTALAKHEVHSKHLLSMRIDQILNDITKL